METRKSSFVVYTDIREPLEDLTDEQVGKLFRALLDYVADGKKPSFRGSMKMAFSFIRRSIDRNEERYREISERRSVSGRAGGLASGESRRAARKVEANEANASFGSSNEANEANEANAILLEATKLSVPVPVSVPDNEPVPVSVNTTRTRARKDDTTDAQTVCEKCGRTLTKGVADYSFDRFGSFLCQSCQKKTPQKGSPAYTGDQTKPDPLVLASIRQLQEEEAEAEKEFPGIKAVDLDAEEEPAPEAYDPVALARQWGG